MKSEILVLCMIASVLAGKQDARIVSGEDVDISWFPSMVSIRINNKHICGGTLLNEEWVLTAAHCLDFPTKNFSIQYGNTEISESDASNVVEVAEIISHDGYNKSSMIHDIGLIKLAEPISDPPEDFRVDLPIYGSNVFTGSPAIAVGWGRNGTNGTIQTTLQAVELLAFSAYGCNQYYKIVSEIARQAGGSNSDINTLETNVCAAVSNDIGDLPEDLEDTTKVKGVCFGDSGGPLFIDGVQVGIASWVMGPCGVFPGGFTATSFYVKWIAEKTGINFGPNIFLRSEAKPSTEDGWMDSTEDAKRAIRSKNNKSKKYQKRKSRKANSKA